MVETMRTKLKKDISDNAGEDEIKKFISKKTDSVNKRLSDYFEDEDEKVKVTSHTLRKIYFREAWMTHGIASDMRKIAYSCEIMGHNELSFASSATYCSVVFC
jgi:hypothetical protein